MIKTFFLDTNVILHEAGCIHKFDEHDVCITMTVLEDVDTFKNDKGTRGYNAREFVRTIDKLAGNQMHYDKLEIGPDKGSFSVVEDVSDYKALPGQEKPDNIILATVAFYSDFHSDQEVYLVSKDANMRIKAKSIGIKAQDYQADQVTDAAYTGVRMVDDAYLPAVETLFQMGEVYDMAGLDDMKVNEYVTLRNGSASALATKHFDGAIRKINPTAAYGIIGKNVEQHYALHALMSELPLVTITGKAGTGKTILALAAALECRSQFRQIMLARPIVPLSNKDIGFLPGDVQEKISPYMQPLYDNLGVIGDQFPKKSDMSQRLKKMLQEEKLIIEPLAYIRGRSLVRKYVIIDEAQNLTPHEVKTIVTRAGEGTKVVFTGDPEQIDAPFLDERSNGLAYLIEKMQGQQLYAHVHLEKGERSELSELASQIL